MGRAEDERAMMIAVAPRAQRNDVRPFEADALLRAVLVLLKT